MTKLVDDCEILRSLGISRIDKNKRSKFIRNRKSSKLINIQTPFRVVSHDAALHYQDSDVFSTANDVTQESFPTLGACPRIIGNSEDVRHTCNNILNII